MNIPAWLVVLLILVACFVLYIVISNLLTICLVGGVVLAGYLLYNKYIKK